MKKTLKSKLIIGLLALASVFVFAGCEIRQTLDDYIEEHKLVAKVTYFANDGAEFDDINDDEKTIYYRDDSKVLNVQPTGSGNIVLKKDHYEFLGWYYVEVDEEGKPLRNADNEIILGDEVDFSIRIQENEHWYVCAKWQRLSAVAVKLVCDENVTISVGEDEEKKTYKNGDVIREYYFNNDIVQATSKAPVEANDGTFVEFSANAEGTEEVVWPIKRPEDRSDVVIYAKYMPGVWTLLRTTDDVKKLFSNESGQNKAYYLMNDIDCEGLKRTPLNTFNSQLQGNGHTISNITFSRAGTSSLSNAEKVSIFGDMKKGAAIENVTFDDITVNYDIRSNASAEAYLIFTSIEEGVKLNKVTINATMTVKLGKTESYMNNDMATNWKYGGVESDAAFEKENPDAFITSGSKFKKA